MKITRASCATCGSGCVNSFFRRIKMAPKSGLDSDSDLESFLASSKLQISSRRSSSGPKYLCSIAGCDLSFKRQDQLDRHEFHHNGIKKHFCLYDDCDKSYSIVTHLKRHIRTTHERTAPPERNVPCSIEGCEKLFGSTSNMQRHIREVHENPKVYHCPDCNEKFTQKLKMRRHIIKEHTGNYPHSCDKCTRGFYQQWQYERHIVSCKIYPCPNCDQHFDKWSLYLKHCRETLHGRKYYKCEHCTRIYSKPGELRKHVAVKHLDGGEQAAYRCNHEGCTRLYAYERNLRQHVQTAHAGKRFDCEIPDCKRAFSSAQNLAKHVEREHNQEAKGKKAAGRKLKKLRKRRKDAGSTVISNLAKLSGLVVDREFDQLLRVRDETALKMVSEIQLPEESETEDIEVENSELNSLLALALED